MLIIANICLTLVVLGNYMVLATKPVRMDTSDIARYDADEINVDLLDNLSSSLRYSAFVRYCIYFRFII